MKIEAQEAQELLSMNQDIGVFDHFRKKHPGSGLHIMSPSLFFPFFFVFSYLLWLPARAAAGCAGDVPRELV